MSLLFDGTGDHITFGSPAKLDDLPTTSGGYSTTCWIYRTGDGTPTVGSGFILDKSDGVGTSGWRFRVTQSTNATPNAIAYDERFSGAPNQRVRAGVANTITNNVWEFLAFTAAPGNTATDIHIYTAFITDPGVAEVSYSFAQNSGGTYVSDATREFAVGSSQVSAPSNEYQGRVAEIQIFSGKILTTAEMNAIFRGNTFIGGRTFYAPLYGFGLQQEADLSTTPSNEAGRGGGPVRADHPPIPRLAPRTGSSLRRGALPSRRRANIFVAT